MTNNNYDAPGNMVRVPKSVAEQLSPLVYRTLQFTDFQAEVVGKKDGIYTLMFDRHTKEGLLGKGHTFAVSKVRPVTETWVAVPVQEIWEQIYLFKVPVTAGMSHQEVLAAAIKQAEETMDGQDVPDLLEYVDFHRASDGAYVATEKDETDQHAKAIEKD